MASAFSKDVIIEGSIQNHSINGIFAWYQFDILLPAYRGSHLSCIESFELKKNGEVVDRSTIRFRLNGKRFLLDQLPDLYQEYWFIRDHARIEVLATGPLAGGDRLQLEFTFRIPYTGYFGSYMVDTGRGDRVAAL